MTALSSPVRRLASTIAQDSPTEVNTTKAARQLHAALANSVYRLLRPLFLPPFHTPQNRINSSVVVSSIQHVEGQGGIQGEQGRKVVNAETQKTPLR